MIYAVIPLRAGPNTIEEIRNRLGPLQGMGILTDVYDKTLPDVVLVSYGGNIRDIAGVLQFGDDEKMGTGIVFQVTQYHGFAPQSLWEWIDQNHERKPE